ncbi:MAG: YggT family protein [Spirochaetaceae bacterium]|nr:YggT family protein [Spirochaetaceae bacterium]
MQILMSILGGFTSLYMILIFVRILLTWFSGSLYGKPAQILCRITDPYLEWFRRFPALRFSTLDLSPIVALGVLSVANNIFITLGRYGSITLGLILAMLLSVVRSTVFFILGFFIVILVLRLIAYLLNRNVYRSFWGIIDTLSRPISYRINRIIFRDRLVRYHTGLIVSIVTLLGIRIILGILLGLGIGFLARLPL